MTMLAKFRNSAKGAALAGALAAALLPAGHASAARYDAGLLASVEASGSAASQAERERSADTFLGDIARMEAQAAVLEKLHGRVARKNAELNRAMQCFEALGAELQAAVRDHGGLPPRRQVELLAASAASWLDRMKGEMADPACSPGTDAAEASPAAAPETDERWSSGDLPQKMEALESRIKSAADFVDAYVAENARIEDVLRDMVADLDTMMNSAADPASDVAVAYAGFEKFTSLLTDFKAADSHPSLRVVGMEDDVKGDIRGSLPGMPGGVE